jgi:hypothetical protein
VIVHQAELGDQSVNQSIVGIDSDRSYPIGCEIRDVLVKKLDCAHAYGDEEQALDELEDGDDPETFAVVLMA